MPYTPGPFDSAHLYLQWGGKLPGLETWSCGIRLFKTSAGPPLLGDVVAGMNECVAAVTKMHTDADTQIHANCKLNYVKLNIIGTDGHYLLDGTNETVLPDTAGASTFPPPANQIALAVTTETGFSRGVAHRGRFYLPMPAFQPDVNGLINAVSAKGVAEVTDTFIDELKAAFLPDYVPAVMSRKAGSPGHRAILYTKIGRVLDTQRRRRRSLKEDYQIFP